MRAAVTLVICLAAPAAHAMWGWQPNFAEYATVGPLLTAASSERRTLLWGAGVEATYGHAAVSPQTAALGGFAQARYLGNGAFEVGGGLQPSFLLFGLELGASYRTATSAAPGQSRLHLAPFVSAAGIGSLAVRVEAPADPTWSSGFEVGVALTFKARWHRPNHGEWEGPVSLVHALFERKPERK